MPRWRRFVGREDIIGVRDTPTGREFLLYDEGSRNPYYTAREIWIPKVTLTGEAMQEAVKRCAADVYGNISGQYIRERLTTLVTTTHNTLLARIRELEAENVREKDFWFQLSAANGRLMVRAEAAEAKVRELEAQLAERTANADFLRESVGECHLMISRNDYTPQLHDNWKDTDLPPRFRKVIATFEAQVAAAKNDIMEARLQRDEWRRRETTARADTERLKWLQENEANLITHREPFGDDGYSIWWNVAKGSRSISGHPLGSPCAAIDEAIALLSAPKGASK